MTKAAGKQTRELIRRIEDAGLAVELTNGGHLRVHRPGASWPFVVVSGTRVHPRCWLNSMTQIRRTFGVRL